MFTFFGLTFGLLELILWPIFIVAMTLSTYLDRNGTPKDQGLKWFVTVSAVILFGLTFWSSWSFFGPAVIPAVMDATGKVATEAQTRIVLWDVVRSGSLWQFVALFVVTGLLYSVLEFGLAIRREANRQRIRWNNFLDSIVDYYVDSPDGRGRQTLEASVRDLKAKADAGDVVATKALTTKVNSYANDYNYLNRNDGGFVKLEANGFSVSPKIDAAELAGCISVWTIWWPFYLCSLILGNLIIEFFDWASQILVRLSNKFVKVMFGDIFAFK